MNAFQVSVIPRLSFVSKMIAAYAWAFLGSSSNIWCVFCTCSSFRQYWIIPILCCTTINDSLDWALQNKPHTETIMGNKLQWQHVCLLGTKFLVVHSEWGFSFFSLFFFLISNNNFAKGKKDMYITSAKGTFTKNKKKC